jgi:glycyl-tRNA synthetase beta chain
MAELLLELFSEEIPARMQARAAADLQRLVVGELEAAGLKPENTSAHATPRRLVLVVDGLPLAQPDASEERRGPRVGAPDKAIAGFAKSAGVEPDQMEQRETKKGAFYYALIESKGRPTADVIAEIIPQVVRDFPWPKSMRWGASTLRWVRPLHSVLCLLDGAVVPYEIDGICSGNTTRGHRFMGPDEFAVTSFDEYQTSLRAARVMLDRAERQQVIADGAAEAAAAEGLELMPDDELIAEISGLIEWPVPLKGVIDDEFMSLPPEVLRSSIRAHQKYLLLRDPETKALAPRFVVVSNLLAEDGGAKIIAGNERVLRARLSDAKFFWDLDRQATLESRLDQLSGVVFHKKIGTVGDKVGRVETLARSLCAFIPDADPDTAARAAQLAKADLVTGMVGEFPELQGVMGRYYAHNDGESDAVVEAIASHYAPQGPSDDCPSAPVSVAIALADKIDTLAMFFAIDEKPTGSKDPFALRRAALGVIRLILENGLRLPLRPVFDAAADSVDGLLGFFADRLKVHLREKGVRHDLITALFSLGDEDDLVRLLARVDALGAFLKGEDGANLLAAYKRASNILRIEEKKDDASYTGAVDTGAFEQAEETVLHDRLSAVGETASIAIAKEDFTGGMAALAQLRAPLDAFFEDVTVNADDPKLRTNRLNLLSKIRTTLEGIADFSKIEG